MSSSKSRTVFLKSTSHVLTILLASNTTRLSISTIRMRLAINVSIYTMEFQERQDHRDQGRLPISTSSNTYEHPHAKQSTKQGRSVGQGSIKTTSGPINAASFGDINHGAQLGLVNATHSSFNFGMGIINESYGGGVNAGKKILVTHRT